MPPPFFDPLDVTPPMPAGGPRPLDGDWFPVRIVGRLVVNPPLGYLFREVRIDGAGVRSDKVGGRINTTSDPATPLDGHIYAVGDPADPTKGDLALCRRGPSAGGLRWELAPVSPGFPDPLVRVTARTTAPGIFLYRYSVRQIVLTGTLPTVNAVDGSQTWDNVIELHDTLIPPSSAPDPAQGIFRLGTAPDGHKYLDTCCPPLAGSSSSSSSSSGSRSQSAGSGSAGSTSTGSGSGGNPLCCGGGLPDPLTATVSGTPYSGPITLTGDGLGHWGGSATYGGTGVVSVSMNYDPATCTWTFNISGVDPAPTGDNWGGSATISLSGSCTPPDLSGGGSWQYSMGGGGSYTVVVTA